MVETPKLPAFAQGQEALAEASPSSLEELFSRDPLEMAVEDDTQGGRNFETIVAELRKMRERHKETEAKIALGEKVKKEKPLKVSTSKAPPTTLEDLGL